MCILENRMKSLQKTIPFLVAVFSLTCVQCAFFDTCMELAKKKYRVPSGTKLFKPRRSTVKDYIIYCDFQDGYGYTFISGTTLADANIFLHNIDLTDFKIIFMTTDGTQHEAVVSPSDEKEVLDVQYTKNEPDVDILVHNKGMNPYITYTNNLIVTNSSVNKKSLSYLVNGTKVTTVHECQSNTPLEFGRLVWAFFFNQGDKKPLDDKESRMELDFLRQWVKLARPVDNILPRNFFTFFETSYKTCNGYLTVEDFPDIIGAAVGLRYDNKEGVSADDNVIRNKGKKIKCPEPASISNGYYALTGYLSNDTVTYVCNEGFEIFYGDTQTCNSKGEWIGTSPICKLIKPRSCADVAIQFGATVPGEYVIYSSFDVPRKVYCEFHGDHVFTFISADRIIGIDFEDLYNDNTEVIVRAHLFNGQQVQSTLTQWNENKGILLDIEFSYASTLSVKFSSAIQDQGQGQNDVEIGYQVNGERVEQKLQNCCEKSSDKEIMFFSYPGKIGRPYTGAVPLPPLPPTQEKWLTGARPIPGELYMPVSYYSRFMIYIGHSPVYQNEFTNVTGMALGVRYNLE